MTKTFTAYAADLPRRSQGLIDGVSLSDSRIPDTVLLTGRYNLDAYAPALFEEFAIPFPSRLHKAVAKRQAEYLAGRIMGQSAQIAIGELPETIGHGKDRAPIWPAGLQGSLSHAHGFTTCLLRKGEDMTLGVDAEKVAEGRALKAILKQTLSEPEKALLNPDDHARQATLVFSAKEALFKALYPHVRRHFGFDCAELIAPVDTEGLTLRLTISLSKSLPEGREYTLHCRDLDTHVMCWLAVQ